MAWKTRGVTRITRFKNPKVDTAIPALMIRVPTLPSTRAMASAAGAALAARRGELEQRERVLRHGGGPHAHVVHGRQERDGADRERQRRAAWPPQQRHGVMRERHRYRRRRAGRDHEQQGPPVQERGQRAEGVSEIDVAAARPRLSRAPLGEAERPPDPPPPPPPPPRPPSPP